jgi:hypothetical protein
MSVESGTVDLNPVYAATATDALVRFSRPEKAALFVYGTFSEFDLWLF